MQIAARPTIINLLALLFDLFPVIEGHGWFGTEKKLNYEFVFVLPRTKLIAIGKYIGEEDIGPYIPQLLWLI